MTADQPLTHDEAHGALKRIRNILNTPTGVNDERGYRLITNLAHDAATSFIRDHLDLHTMPNEGYPTAEALADEGVPDLPTELAAHIVDDLITIWSYGYFRDELSTFAMGLSLCPLHFWDWAICFDDEEPECATIRAIFPHSHDT